jgi:hypothetical protein
MILFERPPGRDPAFEKDLRGKKWAILIERPILKATRTGRLIASLARETLTATLFARDRGEASEVAQKRWPGATVTVREYGR